MMIRDWEGMIMMRGLKIKNFTWYFQEKANLDTGKVAGYYYNTHTRISFKKLSNSQVPDNKTSLLNQRIQNCTQVPPLTNH